VRDIPSITALQAFEAAARRLSFKHAADELNLTAGAVSRQIQALEAELGAPLFQRLHRQVRLTPAGAGYLADIAAPLAALRAAGDRVRAQRRTPTVSVVAYPTFAVRWFMPRWGRFLDAHPEIDLQLSTSLDAADFARGDVDLAIHVDDGRAPSGERERFMLMEMDLFPVTSPVAAARLSALEDLAGETLLHAAPRPDDWPRWLATAGVAGVDAGSGRRFESQNLAIQAAIEGLGVAIGFPAIVADDIAAGRLAAPFDIVRRSGHAMLISQSPTAAPEAQAVRDWLLQEAAAMPNAPWEISSARNAASAGSAP